MLLDENDEAAVPEAAALVSSRARSSAWSLPQSMESSSTSFLDVDEDVARRVGVIARVELDSDGLHAVLREPSVLRVVLAELLPRVGFLSGAAIT
ncbi:MAG: hypothetical protein ACLTSX_01045 [Collinsella sp.]